jgi:Flp pilus assembly protein protease CpaA
VWLGWSSILDYGVAAAIFGGALTLIILSARMAPLPPGLGRVAWSRGCTTANRACPTGSRWRRPD